MCCLVYSGSFIRFSTAAERAATDGNGSGCAQIGTRRHRRDVACVERIYVPASGSSCSAWCHKPATGTGEARIARMMSRIDVSRPPGVSICRYVQGSRPVRRHVEDRASHSSMSPGRWRRSLSGLWHTLRARCRRGRSGRKAIRAPASMRGLAAFVAKASNTALSFPEHSSL